MEAQVPNRLVNTGESQMSLVEELRMSDTNRLFFLRIALVAVGVIFIVGVYALSILWPSGWVWGHGHSHYLTMIMGVYATLGVFLINAARNPEAHRSLISFTVWSSLVHSAIMAVQSLSDASERGHLVGDVPALLIIAAVLGALMPRGTRGIAP
jgi:hypothetical protein